MPSSRAVQQCVAARVPRAADADAPEGFRQNGHSIDRTTAPYRFAARHLRGRFAGDPVRLQRSLLDLARRQDARRGHARRRESPVIPTLPNMPDGDVADRFAARVSQHVKGVVLCYEDRQSLLTIAGRLGIGRFEANLIIAAVQHRLEKEHTVGSPVHTECCKRTGRWWPAVIVVLAVETTLSLAAWWMIRQ
jgi:hypothetical protein